MLVRGFKGGYMYPDKAGEVEPMKLRPIKNEFSHPHDALQYVAGAVKKKLNRPHTINIPLPQYSFQHQEPEELNG